jgi:hypothetical protein
MAVRHVGSPRQEVVQGFWFLIRGFGESACNEFTNLWNATDVRYIDQGWEWELADTGPNEEREVMIRTVLLIAE